MKTCVWFITIVAAIAAGIAVPAIVDTISQAPLLAIPLLLGTASLIYAAFHLAKYAMKGGR